MLGFAWVTLRQAQEALKNGRLEEAHRLLCQPDSQGQKGSCELMQQLARSFAERGLRHLEHDDAASAWNDLILAEQVGGADEMTTRLRQALVRRDLSEARKLFNAGEPGRSAEACAHLRDRGVQQNELQLLEDAARAWSLAKDLAARGEFALALPAAERVGRLVPEVPAALGRFQQELVQSGKEFAKAVVALHEALKLENWREVLVLSEQVLVLAPQHAEARKARARAWKSIEPATSVGVRIASPETPPAEAPAPRYLLWVDGVGGFLVCMGTRVTIGQAVADAFVDIPLFADISRVHAVLHRDDEVYVIEALRHARVNNQVAEKMLLRSGDCVTLGSSCKLQFEQPVPVSTTARLSIGSAHRLPLSLDAVFLMADTLVLGPGPQAHVLIPEMAKPVVLFRCKDGLGVRHAGKLQVDGQPCRERGLIGAGARVSGEDFSFAVEPVGARLGK